MRLATTLLPGLALLSALALLPAPGSAADRDTALVIVVMDPLALPLSCPCVKGHAQRDYDRLGAHVQARLKRPVRVHFAESLADALARKTAGRADLVIGKASVVRHAAAASKLDLAPLADLTDREGRTTQTGLWVVADSDPALTAADLAGYELLVGAAEAEEKHAAALALLRSLEVKLPRQLTGCTSCSEAAQKLLEAHRAGRKAAAAISSYARPLLEGCGTVKKGELRVIGETDAVPFVVAFANGKLPADDRAALRQALLEVGSDAKLCQALETKRGFVALAPAKKK